jgi:glutaminyl-peptide cyclotransferase
MSKEDEAEDVELRTELDRDDTVTTDNSEEGLARFVPDAPPKDSFFKTRLFFIVIVVILIVALFVISVFVFGLISRTNTIPIINTRHNIPLTLVDNYTREIISFGVRTPGSPGNIATQNMITRVLSTGNWIIEYDSFSDNTPEGLKNFTNIIATFKYPKKRSAKQQLPQRTKLIIAAHFDSKYFAPNPNDPNDIFIGATDSVVPCAMMLQMALAYEVMIANSTKPPNFDLQFVFFDGEEAFRVWSRTDSTYGSRHLAQLWETQQKLKSIDVFVLLDLIGTSDVKFPNFKFQQQQRYEELYKLEQSLRANNRLKTNRIYFDNVSQYSYIEDDHIPFQTRGVSILHIISSPFPSVWHTKRDNYAALNWDTIYDIQNILLHFLHNRMFGTV